MRGRWRAGHAGSCSSSLAGCLGVVVSGRRLEGGGLCPSRSNEEGGASGRSGHFGALRLGRVDTLAQSPFLSRGCQQKWPLYIRKSPPIPALSSLVLPLSCPH